MGDLRIITPDTEADIAAVRTLCWEYHGFLRALSPFDAEIVDMFYPAKKYAALMERLAEEHAPPDGFMSLALRDGEPVGCGMVHRLSPEDAEIKRVYVNEDARGTGAGFALMSALIEGCRDLGFARILMDTSKPLTAAQRLYTTMGFRPRGPYQEVPPIAEGHLLFFEMRL
ncbi:GNAT family N-acetyltransferase [Primorskyibacter aestuariivivens]|uniref:GNAT family N-acetyltransferase n=1 Tax=Primorskyibacter aestuariivivens TaxID=1888912 RepID=UPI002301DE29|nr:GNAT family N-acetyltransferase [Primorskyibacter aestuariivivens]MDA7430319.1 GNAT family N-acetyltransferase [Primorskyibacter aestuariivivens]